MPYQFQPKKLYMMPTSFGPRPYRRGSTVAQDVTYAYVNFLTNKEQLEELLPPGFELRGEPVMTVLSIIIGHIEWLAGHGYNILGVSIFIWLALFIGLFLVFAVIEKDALGKTRL